MRKTLAAVLAAVSFASVAYAGSTPKDNLQAALDLTYRTMFQVQKHHGKPDDVTKNAKACVDAADAYLAAGGKAGDMITAPSAKIPGAKHATSEDEISVGDARTYCAGASGAATSTGIGESLGRYQGQLESMQQSASKPAKSNGDTAITWGKKCADEVAAAESGGMTDDSAITVKGKSTTLGQAKAEICDGLVQVGQSIDQAVEQAREAKLAPYKAALSGDKLDVFVNDLFGDDVYGPGGKLLSDSPDALKKASTWFIVLTYDGDDGYTHWTLRRYQFKGAKLVKQSETSGRGDDPPTSAYK